MARDVIVLVFPSRTALVRALEYLMERDNFDIKRAALVAKAADGEIIILDDDISPDEGGIAGGTLGAAMAMLGIVQLGALALPGAGAIIALGAGVLVGGLLGNVTGRFAAILLDFGFKINQVDVLADQLQIGHPALVLELDNAQQILALLRRELKAYRAELIEPLYQASTKAPPSDME